MMIAFIFSTVTLGCIRFTKLAGQYVLRDRSGKAARLRGSWKWKTRLVEVSVEQRPSDTIKPPSFVLIAIQSGESQGF